MLISRALRFWFGPAPPTNLAICRVLFYSGLLVAYSTEDFSLWGSVSRAFWMPLPAFSVLHLRPAGATSLDAIQTIWRVALLTSAVGWHSTASMTVAAALGFYLLGLPHNFGHVYHFDAVLVIALGVMACSRAGDACSLDAYRLRGRRVVRPSGEYTWPVRLIWTATALVFLGAGISKLRHGGIDWVMSDNMSLILTSAMYHVSDADPMSTAGLWIARHGAISRVLAFATLAIELSYVAALWSRRARAVLVVAAAVMLVAIRVLMGPTFGGFLLINIFWVPWDALGGRLSARRAAHRVGTESPELGKEVPLSESVYRARALLSQRP